MSSVFLSYASEDLEFVSAVYFHLKSCSNVVPFLFPVEVYKEDAITFPGHLPKHLSPATNWFYFLETSSRTGKRGR